MNVPVLLITFNRPKETSRVLEALRLVQPSRLFVASDGPRPSRTTDFARCAEVRKLVETLVDWPCEIQTLFQNQNLGCRRGVVAAISWFFEHVSEGIILEDDIVPDPTFFQYQEELLTRFRDDTRVMCVSGHQALGRAPWVESYRFSRFAAIWGWGTWKRVWDQYEPLAESYFQLGGQEPIRKFLKKPQLVAWWHQNLESAAEGRLDTWDVQFCYLLLKTRSLCVIPSESLVENIGFGSDATHTVGDGTGPEEPPPTPVKFPLQHPAEVKVDRWYDRRMAKRNFWNREATFLGKATKTAKKIVKRILRRN